MPATQNIMASSIFLRKETNKKMRFIRNNKNK